MKTLNLNFKAIYIDENKNKMKVICDVTKTKISVRNENNQTILNKVIPDFYYISCKSGKERIGLFNKIYVEFLSENNPLIKLFCKKEAEVSEIISTISNYREEIIKERTDIYNKAVNSFNKGTMQSCEEALNLFSGILSWLDSKAYIEKCNKKISELKEKAEIERKNAIYNKAVAEISKSNVGSYLNALASLKGIETWKDAKDKIKVCEEALNKVYEIALVLMNEDSIDKLQEAIDKFNSLKDFKDSKQLSKQCCQRIDDIKIAIENERKNNIYIDATEISKEDNIKAIDKAISLLKEIEGWKDVDTLIETLCNRKKELERIAEENRKNGIYGEAMSLVQTSTIENLEKAIVLFKTILDWKDSKDQIVLCEKHIKKIHESAFWDVIETEKESCKKQEENLDKYNSVGSKRTKSAIDLFLHNPYCILGLSCKGSQNDALNIKDKVEKFARLKMTNAYKSVFDLKNLEKPSRDISNIQSAIVAAKELSHKWLWFEKEEYSYWWDSAKIFDVLEKEEVECIEYDLLLAAYIQLVVVDGCFIKFDKWNYLLTVIDNMLSLPSIKLSSILKLHIGESSSQESIGTLTESFKKTFLLPFFKLCENADKEQIFNLGKCLKRKFKSKELTDGLATALILNLTNRCYPLESFLKDFPDTNANTEEKDKLVELAKSTEKDVYDNIDVLLNIVGSDSTYAKRIKKKYKELYWDVTLKLLNNNRKATCIPFIKKIYEFCDDNDQRILRNTYGYDQLGISENDLSPGEMNDLAIELENSGQISRAIALFQKAAELGNSFAQSNLAFRYFEGNGVVQNRSLAKLWWIRAAEQGNEIAQNALRTMFQIPHEHYDLGYVYIGYSESKIIEVTLTYIGYVRLMEDSDFDNYINGDTYNYYGGRQTQNPCRIKIPSSGHWHVVVDNDGDELGGISSTCSTRTIPNYY